MMPKTTDKVFRRWAFRGFLLCSRGRCAVLLIIYSNYDSPEEVQRVWSVFPNIAVIFKATQRLYMDNLDQVLITGVGHQRGRVKDPSLWRLQQEKTYDPPCSKKALTT